jgi:hypothetical protein
MNILNYDNDGFILFIIKLPDTAFLRVVDDQGRVHKLLINGTDSCDPQAYGRVTKAMVTWQDMRR